MKKFAAVIAVAVLVAFAAPAFAAINPFMDVPMNHWAYDAIGQLAAHGILSGYPDGTYKGKQPTTRYEMASALARALAVVDMTKASKQDVEMLKRLVIEFKDELEALGVRVDDLDERVSLIESRLGGWKLSGRLRLDIGYNNSDSVADGTAKGSVATSMARLWFDRWFGDPDNPMHFRARLDGPGDTTKFNQFYVEVPAWFDTVVTFGRFCMAFEEAYYIGGDSGLGDIGGYGALDDLLTDRNVNGIGIAKNFGLGSFQAYLSHTTGGALLGYDAWEVAMIAKLQFTEQIGVDLGAQIFAGDNSDMDDTVPGVDDATVDFHNAWTVFAGLRFNFMDGVAFKGIFYHQQVNGDVWNAVANSWDDADYDSANHWRVILDVNQDVLKFTSAWLEYGQMDEGFSSLTDLNGQGAMFSGKGRVAGISLLDDMKYWRIALAQQWTEKWGTHLFYYGYNFDELEDLSEWGLGVTYKYNDNVKFGLNYVNIDYKGDEEDALDESKVRFRTQIDF